MRENDVLLGCIADDFTGASDLANTLTVGGMRTIQTIGVPGDRSVGPAGAGTGADTEADTEADAIVVALKTRSVDAVDAVAQSLDALRWLKARGARQILFKYCSTFDSTPKGNIGPVADALLEALDAPFTIACPAFPANRRTIYRGHLFVGDRLLSESGMQDHPLTPMTDPDLVRWLQRQSRARVGLLPHAIVDQGPAAIVSEIDALIAAGVRIAIADALADRHLRDLGTACAGLALITGGSGIAVGLPENFRRAGLLQPAAPDDTAVGGPAVVLSGSCSVATRAQIERYRAHAPARLVAADAIVDGGLDVDTVAQWVLAQPQASAGDADPDAHAPLVYTSADPETVRDAQRRYGTERVSQAVEAFTGRLAARLAAAGVRRFVVAGGETSGAVVQALDVRRLAIGAEIAPGVPALRALDRPIALALKSGNFGAPDFFSRALRAIR
ncbi:MAG: 3-oxo-tetronate kinase [Lautropia sp.]